MHEVVIISGKGGAGKTTITGAFAHLAQDAIICDLDVDAPDLHLLLSPILVSGNEFWSGNEAAINGEDCTLCGLCAHLCRFNAIEKVNSTYQVKPFHCEGCKVCVEFCPTKTIAFPEKHCGNWFVSDTRFSPMIHAQLYPGEENSGRLVTLLKKRARAMAEDNGLNLILSDGAPGIGCPVISSLAGTDLAVVVTEPTPSGMHDLQRVAELCDGFRTTVAVLINKWDINPDLTDDIEQYCAEKNYTVVGRLPHTRAAIDAMVAQQVLTEFDPHGTGELLKAAWSKIMHLLKEHTKTKLNTLGIAS